MMATPGFISKRLNQTLVYWGNPKNDGFGTYTFDDPVEIRGRCEYKVEMVLSVDGEELVSRARVYLEQEVDGGGYLYLGTLDDSVIGDDQSPSTTEGSMRILAFEKIPSLDDRGSLYKAYVNM